MAWRRSRATAGLAGLALCVLVAGLASGCGQRRTAQVPETQEPTTAEQRRQPGQTMAIVRRDRPTMAQPDGTARGDAMVTRTVQLPAGEAGQPVVVEYRAPREVAVGQPFDYEMIVTNRGEEPVEQLTVQQQLPAHFKVISSEPAMERAENGASTWELGELAPGDSRTIRLTGRATEARPLRSAGSTSYLSQVSLTTQVVQPSVGLTASVPEDVLICETIPVNLTITNNGTGMARDVELTQELPDGLVTAEGDSLLEVPIGSLAAGDTQQYTLNLEAVRTGQYTIPLGVSSGELTASTEVQTTVREPVLNVSMDAEQQVQANEQLTYTLSVRNTGDALAENAQLRTQFPAEVEFIEASDGGRQVDGEVLWELGEIPANGSKQVTLTLRPTAGGMLNPRATASARCARAVQASSETEVRGEPVVRLEVSDEEDPVEVGQQVTYRITATNQGSEAATNIRLQATTEEQQSMEVASAGGATEHELQQNVVEFAPVQNLEPGEQVTWQVTTRAREPADQARFIVRLISDQIDQPIEQSETTRLNE